MTAIVSGNNLGLNLGSLASLGGRGLFGSAAHGHSGERAYVNVSTGGLVLQDQDLALLGRGPDALALRTYNSQGTFDFDNGDGWTGAPYRSVQRVDATTLRRTDADGSTCDYLLDAVRGLYVATVSPGSVADTIAAAAGAGGGEEFTWTDGATGTRERYAGGAQDRALIRSMTDLSGNALEFAYDANGLIESVTTSDGEVVRYAYGPGRQLTSVRSEVLDPQTGRLVVAQQVGYGYDAQGRLETVTVQVAPARDGEPARSYVTTYGYEASSTRVASITQSDGSSLAFTYTVVAGEHRVETVVDGNGARTRFDYGVPGQTAVTDASGATTVYVHDAAGRLTEVRAGVTPANPRGLTHVHYTYNTSGDVTSVRDGLDHELTFVYEGDRLTLQTDAAGNRLTRTYTALNQVATETLEPGAGLLRTTRNVYDAAGKGLLRFSISPEGRVTEYRYDAWGQQTSVITYAGAAYDLSGLGPADVPAEAALAGWAQTQDRVRTTRVDLAHDYRGQLTSRTTWEQVDAAGNGVGAGAVEQYLYDQRGLLLRTITPGGRATTTLVHDGMGRVLSTLTTYDDGTPASATVTQYDDANGRTTTLLARTRVNAATGEIEVLPEGLATTSVEDRAGRLIGVVQSSAGVALGATRYAYDAAGRLLMTEDPTGARRFALYDQAGRKVGEVDPAGTLTETVYDAAGRVALEILHANPVDTAALVDAQGAPTGIGLAELAVAPSDDDGKTWRFYDDAGRLTWLVDALGEVSFSEYDGASRVVSVTRFATRIAPSRLGSGAGVTLGFDSSATIQVTRSAKDRVVRSIHDRDGLLVGTIDGEGYLTELRRDAAGRVVETRAYATRVPRFEEADVFAARLAAARAAGTLDALLQQVDAARDVSGFAWYDASGRVVAELDGERYLTRFTYDANGQVATTTRFATPLDGPIDPATAPVVRADREDQALRNTYDAAGRLSTQTNAEGTVTRYGYDARGRLVETTVAFDGSDRRTTLARYDVQGRITAELSAEGAALLSPQLTQAEVDAIWAAHATTYAYDAAGRRKSATDALGHRTAYLYDDAGRVRFTIDALGDVSETTYDALGRVERTTAHATRLQAPALARVDGGLLSSAANAEAAGLLTATGFASADDSRTAFEYDAVGRLVKTTGPEGETTERVLDAFGGATETRQRLDAARTLVTSASYDRRGLSTGGVADVGAGADHVNARTRIERDAFGRVTETEDANGNVRNVAYDRLGRAVQSFEPADDRRGTGRVTTYDAFGRTLTQVDIHGKATTYVYDRTTRSVTTTTPEGVVVKVVRDGTGQTQSITDGNGNVTRFTYDRRGNLRTTTRVVDDVDVARNVVTENLYDRLGRIEWTIDGEGHRVHYVYDAANRVLSRTVDPGGLNLVTGYGYDAKGLQVTVTDPNGTLTRIAYDRSGRALTRTVDPDGLALVTAYTYDDAGRVLTEENPAGTVTEHHYDRLGRRRQTIVDPDGLKLRTTYTYDANGNVVASADANGNVTRYVYGPGDRLRYTVDGAAGVKEQEYDAAGRVIRTTRYAGPIDLAGLPEVATPQQVRERVRASADLERPDVVERRVYDADGRLTDVVDGAGGVTRYTYDRGGNVVAQRTYAARIDLSTWDGARAPAVAVDAQRDRRTYTVYDALGRAIYTVDGTGAAVAMNYDRNGNVVERAALADPISLAAVEALGDPAATPAEKAAVPDAVATEVRAHRDATRDAHLRRAYDRANRLSYSVDGTGAVTRQVFDRAGNLVKTIAYATRIGAADAPEDVPQAPADRVSVQSYDAAGRTSYAVDATGSVTRELHDDAGNVVQRIQYGSPLARPTASSDPVDVAVAAAALDADATVQRRTSRSAYDRASRQLAAVDAAGAVVAFDYDGNGNVVAKTSYATLKPGAAPTLDAQGRLEGMPQATAEDRTELRAYDGAGRLVYSVDAEGYVTGSEYDGVGRCVISRLYQNPTRGLAPRATAAAIDRALDVAGRVFQRDRFGFDGAGHVVRVTDSLDQVENSRYDGAGNLRSSSKLDGATGIETAWDYDAAGRVVTTTSPPADVWSVEWSVTEQRWLPRVTTAVKLVTRVQYDALGNVTARIEAEGRLEQRVTRYDYDVMGRQMRTRLAEAAVYREPDATLYGTGAAAVALRSETDPTSHTSEVFYDAFGDAAVGKDTLGQRTYKVHDARGRVRFEIDALGYVTGYERDGFGDVVKVTRYARRPALTLDPEAAPTADEVSVALDALDHSGDRTLTTSYDAMGRAELIAQPASWVDLGNGVTGTYAATTRNVYDAFGQITRRDALVDPVARTWASTEHRFDRRGHEVTTIDALGYVTAQQYDAAGNVTRRIEHAKALTPTAPGEYDLSRLATSADDRRTDYGYDRLNRLESETRFGVECADENFVVARRNLTTTYDHDRLGNVTRIVDPLGGERRRYFDALGRVRAETSPLVSGVEGPLVPLTRFGYDGLGNLVVRTGYAYGAERDPENGTTTESAAYPDPAADRTFLIRYDVRGNAIEEIDAGGFSHYASYDAAGRAVKTWSGVTGNDLVTRIMFSLVRYDAVGRQVAVVTPAPTSVVRGGTIETSSQAEAGTVTTATGYDAFGEICARSTALTGQAAQPAEFFEYDGAGHLWRTNAGDGVVKVYLYDLLGRRTAQITSNGGVDLLRFTSASQVAEATGQVTIKDHFAGAEYRVEQFEFSDGVAWDEAALRAHTSAHVEGTSGADDLQGHDGPGGNTLRGLAGDDTLTGGRQADVLDGGDGSDRLIGNGGADALRGGAGDDRLEGGTGNDTYIARRCDGRDTIVEDDRTPGNVDTIRLVDAVSGEVILERRGNDLVVRHGDGDEVIVSSCFAPTQDAPGETSCTIERIELADGVSWGRAEIVARTTTATGTSGSDCLTGHAGVGNHLLGLDAADHLVGQELGDELEGGSGDDTLVANGGDDFLDGGAGNDQMRGGAGNDVFALRRGSGQDRIDCWGAAAREIDRVWFEDVAAREVTSIERVRDDLVVVYGEGDQVTLGGYFCLGADADVKLEFSDGVCWRRDDVLAREPVTRGTSAADWIVGAADARNQLRGLEAADGLVGGALDDVIDGGSGDDRMGGGGGDDTYVLRRGSGSDVLRDDAGTADRIVFEDVASTELAAVERRGDDLFIRYGDGDELRIVSWFTPAALVELFQFSDGVTLDAAALGARAVLVPGNPGAWIAGTVASDRAVGGAGDDTLATGGGDDVLDGGAGADALHGGAGSDTYVLRKGSGQDVILDEGGCAGEVDTIAFADVASTEVTGLERQLDDLVVRYGASDEVRIRGYFNGGYEVERLRFADGVTWTRAEVLARNPQTIGTSGNDWIAGYANGANRMSGLEGADTLAGGAGDDVLDGGAGDDVLRGEAGSDTYVLRKGSGQDVIREYGAASGDVDTVSFADVKSTEIVAVERRLDDLVIRYGATDEVTIDGFFSAPELEVERFQFADGITWTRAELLARRPSTIGTTGDDWIAGYADGESRMLGLAGNDTLKGAGGADVLDGGAGDDALYGKAGDDTYVLRKGSGRDVIADYDASTGGVDTVSFADVASTEITGVERRMYDLVITYGDADQVTIENFFAGPEFEVEQFRFADGVTWTRAELLAQKPPTKGSTGDDWLEGYADGENRMLGLDGNDTLKGSARADVLDGGAGDDKLLGKGGDDTYVVRKGSGRDTIVDYDPAAGNVDVVSFTDIGSGQVTAVERRQDDLVITYGDADQVTIESYFAGSEFEVEQFRFADGVTWTRAELLARVGETKGSQGDDWIEGLADHENRMSGLGGDDTLKGGARDDVLDGGVGNDLLKGRGGSDTYVLRRGAGIDRIGESGGGAADRDAIEFTNVASIEATVFTAGKDLVIRYGAGDQVTVDCFFAASECEVEEVRFADGVTWDRAAIEARLTIGTPLVPPDDLALDGTSGDDTLTGGPGDDRLSGHGGDDRLVGAGGDDLLEGGDGDDVHEGGGGDDTLDGGAGNDTYVVQRGSGQDTITDHDAAEGNRDVLRFLDVGSTDVTSVARVGNDLVITYGATGGLRRTDTRYDLLDHVVGQILPERVGADGATLARPVITLEVDRWGNVTRQLDVRNPAWATTFRYDANNQVVEEAQPDGAGHPGAVVTTTAHDALGRQVMVADANGHVNRQVFDGAGNLVREIHADCKPVYEVLRDVNGWPVLDAAGKIQYVQERDPATGQPVFSGGDPIYVQAKDAQGRPLFDANYRPVHEQQRDASGNPVVDAGGNPVYVQARNAAGQPLFTPRVPVYVQQRDYYGRLMWEDEGSVERRYSAFGEEVLVKDARGLTTEFRYDHLGRQTSISTAEVDVVTVGTNDQLNAAEHRRLTTVKKYDEAGRLLSQTNGARETTRHDYDLRGNRTVTTEPMQEVTRSAFDAQGKEIGNLDANGNLATWRYDGFGRVQAHLDLGGATYEYTYDNAQQLVSQRNSRGQAIDYRYDGAGQVTRIDAALVRPGGLISNTQETTYAYNAAGQRVLERTVHQLKVNPVTAGGITMPGLTTRTVDQDQVLGYDALGRLSTVTTRGALEGVSVTFRYDAVGNRMRQTNVFPGASGPETQELFYAYDEMNRQILVDGALNNDATDTRNVVSGQGHLVTYDKAGNRRSDTTWRTVYGGEYVTAPVGRGARPGYTGPRYTIAGSGVATEYYEYDALNRLSTVSRDLPTLAYHWQSAGRGGAYVINKNPDGSFVSARYVLDTRKYDGASRVVYTGPGGGLPRDLPGDDFDAIGAVTRLTRYDPSGRVVRQLSVRKDGKTAQALTYSGVGYTYSETVYEQLPVYSDVQAQDPVTGALRFRDGPPILVPQVDASGAAIPGRFVQQVVNGVPQFQQVPVYVQATANGVPQFTQGAPKYVQLEVNGVKQYERVPVYRRVVDLAGRPVFDAGGNPVYVQQRDAAGNPVVDADGNPVYVQETDASGAPLFQQGPPMYVQDTDDKGNLRFDEVTGDPLWKVQQVTRNADVGYDRVGNIAAYQVYDGKSNTTSYYQFTRQNFEGYREGVVTGNLSGAAQGRTTNNYDVNGFLVGVDDATKDANDRSFANDVNGVVLKKTQGGNVLRQLVVNGAALGVYGSGVDPANPTDSNGNPIIATRRDLSQNFQSFTASSGASATEYTVRAGDTLQGIARALYGDPTLWYLVGDANGVVSDADLQVGQTLTVPARVAGTTNSADTFRPYDPSDVVGSTSPNLPSPKPKKKCDIVQIIVIAVIVVAVSVATYGAASAAMGAVLGATAGSAGTLLGSTVAASIATGVVAGAASGAAASMTSQFLGGEDFSWRDVGMAALTGAVTGGFAKGLGPNASAWAQAGMAVGGAVTANVAVQLHKMTYGTQKDFNWWGVAAAAAAGVVQAAAGFGANKWSPSDPAAAWGADVLKETLTGVAAGTTAKLVNHLSPAERHQPAMSWDDLWMMTADAFGNALGNSTASAVKADMKRAEEEAQRDAERQAFADSLKLRPPELKLPERRRPSLLVDYEQAAPEAVDGEVGLSDSSDRDRASVGLPAGGVALYAAADQVPNPDIPPGAATDALTFPMPYSGDLRADAERMVPYVNKACADGDVEACQVGFLYGAQARSLEEVIPGIVSGTRSAVDWLGNLIPNWESWAPGIGAGPTDFSPDPVSQGEPWLSTMWDATRARARLLYTGVTNPSAILEGVNAMGVVDAGGEIASDLLDAVAIVEGGRGLVKLGSKAWALAAYGPRDALLTFELTDPVVLDVRKGARAAGDLAPAYEKAIRTLYGESTWVERNYRALVDGEWVNGVADGVTTAGGKSIAIEAKFTLDWTKSPYNPDTWIAGRTGEPQRMLAQAQKYAAAGFDQIVYHTTSVDLAAHYSKVFTDAGISNFRFVITPAKF